MLRVVFSLYKFDYYDRLSFLAQPSGREAGGQDHNQLHQGPRQSDPKRLIVTYIVKKYTIR